MYKKVLVPLDGSELDECALNHIRSLVKEDGIRDVTLLKVIRVDINWSRGEYGLKVDLDKIRKSAFAAAREYLDGVASQLGSEGIKVKTEIQEGNRPADTIIEYARRHGMDMIAIASHGYTGVKKLIYGSVADKVLHASPVPVLLMGPEVCRPAEFSKAA